VKEKAEIREFVTHLLANYGDNKPFGDFDDLLSDGRLQSIDAVEIVMFLEGNFGVDFAQVGFDRDRLASVDAIHSIVQNALNRTEG
jgi:acyl carrier protein